MDWNCNMFKKGGQISSVDRFLFVLFYENICILPFYPQRGIIKIAHNTLKTIHNE